MFSELSESVTHTSIAAASESYEGHVTTSTSAAELEPLNDAGLADTLDEHLGGDIVGVDDQLDAAGLVVPLQVLFSDIVRNYLHILNQACCILFVSSGALAASTLILIVKSTSAGRVVV